MLSESLYAVKRSILWVLILCIVPHLLRAQVDSSTTSPANVRMQWNASAVLIGTGTLLLFKNPILDRFKVHDFRMQHFANFKTHVDDILPYTPAMAVYAADWSGSRAKTDFRNRTVILLKAELLMLGIVFPLKNWTHMMRPDGSANNTFPSGHTAQAFMAAQFLHRELGQQSIGYSIAGYSIATAVGALRILNNRHWVSDVCVGAGIGMLSTEIAYATHRYKWSKGKHPFTVLPYAGKQSGLYAKFNF